MSSSVPILFDRPLLRQRRTRAAKAFARHDAILREAAMRAEESLASITRAFPRMASFGVPVPERPGTCTLIRCDITPSTLRNGAGARVVADEEWLPFAENSIDAVVSVFSLHWVNDLPGSLSQIHRVLKPDGLFLAVVPGAETLRELRQVLAETEAAQKGSLTARIAPFIDVREGGALLQRAGFSLPVASSELLTVSYPDMWALMHDLRGMGETNMLMAQQKHFAPRRVFEVAAARYAAQHSDTEGRIPATFEFVTLTGWKPL